MSVSAFGVEHGDISKGLPSSLRSGSPGSLKVGSASYSRRMANEAGKNQAFTQSLVPGAPEHHKRLGRLYREQGKVQELRQVIGRDLKRDLKRKKRTLP